MKRIKDFTKSDKEDIKQLYQKHKTLKQLAKDYNTYPATILRIITSIFTPEELEHLKHLKHLKTIANRRKRNLIRNRRIYKEQKEMRDLMYLEKKDLKGIDNDTKFYTIEKGSDTDTKIYKVASEEIILKRASVFGSVYVSADGSIIISNNKLLKPSLCYSGGFVYPIVYLDFRMYTISRIVFNAWIGPIDSRRRITYKDEDRTNTHYTNLLPKRYNKDLSQLKKVSGFSELYCDPDGLVFVQFGYVVPVRINSDKRMMVNVRDTHGATTKTVTNLLKRLMDHE